MNYITNVVALHKVNKIQVLRTPDERFENLKDYPFRANYLDVPAGDGFDLRMHYFDEGQCEIILCMHAQLVVPLS